MIQIQKIVQHKRLLYLVVAVSATVICFAGIYGARIIHNRSAKNPVTAGADPLLNKSGSTIATQQTANSAKPPADEKPKPTPAPVASPTVNKASDNSPAPTPAATPTPLLSYDETILSDSPVGYWPLSEGSGSVKDKTSNNITGTYYGSTAKTTMPNNESATVFSGSSNTYAEIPDTDNYSITTTKKLTWEAWIRPDNINFVNSTKGYINWMGKCHVLSPTCEWMARFYNLVNTQNRCNRFSAYAFNPTASFGSGAYWQPTCGLIVQSHWMHVVGEYQTLTTPSVCSVTYPGTIDIWVNGVKWDQSYAGTTGCMSQYSITPTNNDSPIDIGTVSKDSWYQGAVGKLAIYNYLLTQGQITSHYKTMTSANPSGSCTASCTLTNP